MKRGKMLKSNLTMLILVVMIFAMLFSTEGQAAKLNKSSLILVKGKTYTLKMKGTKKKVTWKIKNKKIAKLSSKKKSSVKIKAVKAGKTTVTAKIGKKTYKCRITVINKAKKKASGTSGSKTDEEKKTDKIPDKTPAEQTTAKKKVWVITKWATSVDTPVYVNKRSEIECIACGYKTEDFDQAVEHQDNHLHNGEANGYRVNTVYDSMYWETTEYPEEGYWIEIGANENPEGMKWRADKSYPEGGYYYIDKSGN